ncbi:MAG TPA: MFS transporter [Jatrophihabitans sp.]|nr:MFS transporter [Jatrophihabitans sp.]
MATTVTQSSARTLVLPLALAQFIASYAASNMNVAITDIAHDLHTSVSGIQATITLFTLTMASLMIPGSKLTDIVGRKRTFIIGLAIYGAGALLASVAQNLPMLIVSYSLLEGIGSALMIPPIYILITVAFSDVATRGKYFGVVSGAAGLGAATGPLIGGLITSTISWRASFVVQFLVVAGIVLMTLRLTDLPLVGRKPRFDYAGAVLSAAGLFFVVFGVLLTSNYGWGTARKDLEIGGTVIIPKGGIAPVWPCIAIGAAFLGLCAWHLHATEQRGHEPLVSLRLFGNRTSDLGLSTQTVQWLVMQGTFFVTSVYLQEVRGYSAIKTGLALTPATIGVLLASAVAGRMARRRAQAVLIRAGFVATVAGMALLLILVPVSVAVWTLIPGLFLMGAGVGVMLTASVNVVQSSFPPDQQGDISGVSRSVSNLGSSLGVALAGSVLVGAAHPGRHPYALAIAILGVIALLGLLAALMIPAVKPASAVPSGAVGRQPVVADPGAEQKVLQRAPRVVERDPQQPDGEREAEQRPQERAQHVEGAAVPPEHPKAQ